MADQDIHYVVTVPDGGLTEPLIRCADAGRDVVTLTTEEVQSLAGPHGASLAKAQPNPRVVVVTGDGELLMGTGALTVVADQGATNLSVLVLDNGAFGETGRQAGLTARDGPFLTRRFREGLGLHAE